MPFLTPNQQHQSTEGSWEIIDNISEMGQRRDIVTMEDKLEIMYCLSNGMIASDLQ